MSPRLLFLLTTRHAPGDHRERIDARLAAARYFPGGKLAWDDRTGLRRPRRSRLADGSFGRVRVLPAEERALVLHG
jgi:hypothetical protein